MKGIARLVENPKLKAILKENAGIGTEATRTAIIETLLQRSCWNAKASVNTCTPPPRASP